MIRILVLLALILALVATPVQAGNLKPPTGYTGELYSNTLILYGLLGEQLKPVCTAAPYEVVPGGYRLITAGHCVLGQPAAVRYAVADDIDSKLTPVTLEKARWDSSGLDFAQFTLITDEKYSLVKLGDEHDTHIGDTTISVHFSSGITKQVSHGRVSSDVATTPSCDSEFVGCDLGFILQEYAAPGGSGSCVISEDTHEVIGILVFEFEAHIGFVVEPISRFKEFLALPNQERKPSAAAVQHGLTEEQEKMLEEVLKNLPQY